MSKKLVIKKKPDLISTTPTANSYVGLSQLQLLEKVSLLHDQLLKINNYLAQLHRLAVYDYNYTDTGSVEISLPDNHKGFLLDSAIKYRGEWNPNTDPPSLLAEDPLKIGWAYIANADGTMPSSEVEVKKGDFILYDSEGVLFNLSDWTNGRVLEQLSHYLRLEDIDVKVPSLDTLAEYLELADIGTKVPPLNEYGLIPNKFISKDITIEVATVKTIEEMLALPNIYIGDVVKVTDSGKAFQLRSVPSNDFSNWHTFIDEVLFRNFWTYETIDQFPDIGDVKNLYLAVKQNTALEGEEEKLEDYNMLYRWNDEVSAYVAVAGQGSGGGGGGSSGAVRVVSYPIGTPTVYGLALGSEALLQYTYQNSDYGTAIRMLYQNDILIGTKVIPRGINTEDMTTYLRSGLNTFKIYIVDAEGRAAQLIYRITADTVTVTTSFNDAKAIINQPVSIPLEVTTSAQIREVHVKVDGVDRPTYNMVGAVGLENLPSLTHGLHRVEIYVVGKFIDDNNNILYEITSNTIRLFIIYDDGVTNQVIVSSKFNQQTAVQGSNLSIDYVVYHPVLENNTVKLIVDGAVVSESMVNRNRRYWNIKTLSVGEHTLRIQSGGVYIEHTIEITVPDIDVTVLRDPFSLIYLDAGGRSNTDSNRQEWPNLITTQSAFKGTLLNFNWASDGWLEGRYLRIGQSGYGMINNKPFADEISTSGKTLEVEFRTRFALDVSTKLLSCFANNIGFYITPQHILLRGSNVEVKTYFKEDEHVKIAFTIDPSTKRIITYINGIISGVNEFTSSTSFKQLNPSNIHINPEGGSMDIFNFRIYNRVLSAQEILNNYIADIGDLASRVDKITFNDIYDDYGNPSKDKIAGLIPIMMLEGSPLPVAKTRPRRMINITFVHNTDPSLNFERLDMMSDIDVQGTSSLQYPVKNFKIRLDQGKPKNERVPYQIHADAIPERIFTLKADYMDSSHMNNTGLANLFDTIYTEGTPPKQSDPRVRTTIYGYPIVLFHRSNSTQPWVYKGVYNFNLDKDAETTVGLNNEYNYGTEEDPVTFPSVKSFEITFNADAGAGAFQENDLGSMISSFEPRYPEYDGFDIFGDSNMTPSQGLAQAKTYLLSLTTDADLIAEINAAGYEEVVDIYDTHFSEEETEDFIEAFRELIPAYQSLKDAIGWVMYRNQTAAFKTELPLHFNQEYMLKYLISVLVFGLVDNLGKNAMFNTWDDQIWYPNFYDVDTALGLENQGRNIHDYDVEIGDPLTFATTDSWLWQNILTYFNNELVTTYKELRNGVYDYDNILNFLKVRQTDKISEAQYNIDTYAKYIGVTTAWLWMAQGNRMEHVKRWLELRLAFLDSKFLYGSYINDSIAIRMNVSHYTDAYLNLTPFITQYTGVRFTNVAGGTVQAKAVAHETVRVEGPAELGENVSPNLEIWIYGATWLENIGDISHLYPSSISIENAPRLTELIVGSSAEGYSNPNLVQVAIGTNKYLEKVDVRNCINLGIADGSGSTPVLQLVEAVNIKEVYAGNTQLSEVDFPIGSSITNIQLPETINTLILRDMPLLREANLELQGKDNIAKLWIEGVPAVDGLIHLLEMPSLTSVRLGGLQYSLFGLDFLISALEKVYDFATQEYIIFGINEAGVIIDTPVMIGDIKVLTNTPVAQETLSQLANILPNLNIEVNIVPNGLNLMLIDDQYRIVGYTGAITSLLLPKTYNEDITASNNYVVGIENWYNVSSIGDFALYNNKVIKELTIQNTMHTIGDQAFDGASSLVTVVIPASVSTIGYHAFNDSPNVTIFCELSEPGANWDPEWNGNISSERIYWGVSPKPRTFVFNTSGGSVVNDIIDTLLMSPPAIPKKLGYDFVQWTRNGEPVTFPFVPLPTDDEVITFDAEWLIWTYQVKYMKPTNEEMTTWTQHGNTQMVTFGDSLGANFIYMSGNGKPTIGNDNTFKGYKLDNTGDYLTASYIITQDANTNSKGKVVELYSVWINSAGLTFVYDSVNSVYDVTRWTAATGANGSKNVFIPGEWDDGTNGVWPVRNINMVQGNSTIPNRLGSLEIEESATSLSRSLSIFGTSSKSYLTSVTLPEGITSLGDRAFKDSKLTSINIPSSVTSISYYVFQGCSSLTSINIPSGVTSIGYGVFQDCTSLTSINIPSSFTSIGDRAFENCSSLTSINIPSGVTSINSNAFRYCSALTSVTWMRDNIATSNFSSGQFSGTKATFTLSATQANISLALSNRMVLNKDQTTIYVFTGGDEIETLDLSSFTDVTSIGNYAFESCSSLTDIVIPSSVKNINNGGFQGCSSLTSIDLPNSLKSIGNYAFESCSSLTDIVIPSSVTSILSYAFRYCSSLISIDLPNSLTSIGIGMFYGCSSLTDIVIPSSVTSIDNSAFESCSSLTDIVIPSSVTTILSYAFRNCTSLISIDLPNSLTNIGIQTFSGCTSLTDIVIPSGVTSIGTSTFESCSSLTDIVIPSSVTSIGNSAFRSCSSLTDIVVLPTTPPTLVGTSVFDIGPAERVITVPVGKLATYQAATNWAEYASQMVEAQS